MQRQLSRLNRITCKPALSLEPTIAAHLATVRLGILMKCNSCFNFKLSKCIGVFRLYIRGVIDCSEWETEKRQERRNMVKLKRLKL
jgi:hypothetical protein